MAKRKSPEAETEPSREAETAEPSQQVPDADFYIREPGPDGKIWIGEAKRGAKTILSLKGRDEWSEWLTELAEWCRTDRVGVLDRAAAELADRVGFRRPPPRL